MTEELTEEFKNLWETYKQLSAHVDEQFNGLVEGGRIRRYNVNTN
jgi:hypothetical protein